jgi:outer membrane protein
LDLPMFFFMSKGEKKMLNFNQSLNTKFICSIHLFALLSLGLVVSPLALTQEVTMVRIGTVDMQKALQSVESGRKAKAQLEKEFNTKKKDLQEEEAHIKKMGEEFRKQSLVMSEEARTKKQSEIQERILKLQEKTSRSQGEIQRKEQELTEPILSKLRGIISDLAKQKGFAIVLEKNENMVLFSLEKDDITEEVITLFNKPAKS